MPVSWPKFPMTNQVVSDRIWFGILVGMSIPGVITTFRLVKQDITKLIDRFNK